MLYVVYNGNEIYRCSKLQYKNRLVDVNKYVPGRFIFDSKFLYDKQINVIYKLKTNAGLVIDIPAKHEHYIDTFCRINSYNNTEGFVGLYNGSNESCPNICLTSQFIKSL